jgi:hypothetical protein
LPCWCRPSVRSRRAVLLPVATHQKIGHSAMPGARPGAAKEAPPNRGKDAPACAAPARGGRKTQTPYAQKACSITSWRARLCSEPAYCDISKSICPVR